VIFDNQSFFSTINTSINRESNSALGQIRTIGQQPNIVLSIAITTAKNLPNLPIFGGLSIGNVEGIFVPPAKSGLNATIGNLTGINLGETFSPTGPATVAKYASTAVATLVGQVSDAAQDCINQKLLTLTQKNPIANALFNYFFNRSALVGNTLENAANSITNQVNNFLYQKIQIEQFVLLKQEILLQIQKVCNNTNPTSLRNYNSNPNYITQAATSAASKVSDNISNSIIATPAPKSLKWSSLV
jgi:hypothetical protein